MLCTADGFNRLTAEEAKTSVALVGGLATVRHVGSTNTEAIVNLGHRATVHDWKQIHIRDTVNNRLYNHIESWCKFQVQSWGILQM